MTASEPRTGRLGLNEQDTRAFAKHGRYNRTALDYRAHDAAVLMCQEDVALWDEEDRPVRTGPLGLSEAATRLWAEVAPFLGNSPLYEEGRQALIRKCRKRVAKWEREDAS